MKRFRAECRGKKQNKNVSLFHAGVPVGFSRRSIWQPRNNLEKYDFRWFSARLHIICIANDNCFRVHFKAFNILYYWYYFHRKSSKVRSTLLVFFQPLELCYRSLSKDVGQSIEPETCLASCRRANHLTRPTQNATPDKIIYQFFSSAIKVHF